MVQIDLMLLMSLSRYIAHLYTKMIGLIAFPRRTQMMLEQKSLENPIPNSRPNVIVQTRHATTNLEITVVGKARDVRFEGHHDAHLDFDLSRRRQTHRPPVDKILELFHEDKGQNCVWPGLWSAR